MVSIESSNDPSNDKVVNAIDYLRIHFGAQSPESSLTCQFPADFISLFSVHGGRRRSSTIHPSRSPPRRRRCCLTSRCPPAPLV
ncbi:hypothetical protein QYF36_019938 [Acer negundo]|nr:hypothetical protein QYF36_019938 [Acer negundo]